MADQATNVPVVRGLLARVSCENPVLEARIFSAFLGSVKTIDLEGRLVKDGVHKAVLDRQNALTDLVHAIREYRKLADSTPLTRRGVDYAHAVQELNKAIDRAEALCSNDFPSDAMRNPLSEKLDESR